MKKCLLFLCIAASGSAYADDRIAAARECADTRSSIQRLACFDQLFDTPVYLEAVNIPKALQPHYGIVGVINRMEKQRPADNYNLLLHSEIEHQDTKQRRVVLAAPALGAVGARPILALSCIDNISRLQIILPQPLEATRAAVSIQNQKGKLLLSEPWKIIDGGYIVDAGRGVPSIDIAQRLNRNKRIILSSDQAALEGLVFDLEALPKHLIQLANACHWRRDRLRGAAHD